AIRRASSLREQLGRRSPAGLILEIDRWANVPFHCGTKKQIIGSRRQQNPAGGGGHPLALPHSLSDDGKTSAFLREGSPGPVGFPLSQQSAWLAALQSLVTSRQPTCRRCSTSPSLARS